MNKIPFSITVGTNRGRKELEPLFRNTDGESEIIIVDSKYNDDTKDFLTSYIDSYKQIVYVPTHERKFVYAKDRILGLNTAFMYSENQWVIRADDNLEFKPDFFDKCREDIQYFEGMFGHTNFAIIGQKLWGQLKQEKWNDYFQQNLSSRYTEISNPGFTFSFGVLPIEMLYYLNGYTEMYDMGWAFDEEDFLLRGITAGFKYYFDREMMGYSEPHKPRREEFTFNQIIWEFQKLEIQCGKIRAFNSYDIRREQNKMLAVKEDYIIE